MQNMVGSVVEFGDYFESKYCDEYLIKYFQYRTKSRGDCLYMLNNGNDNLKVAEVYQLSNEIWDKVKEFKNKKNKKRNMRVNHYKLLFELIDRELLIMNRIAERETKWILYPLYILANELVKVTFYIVNVLKLEKEYIEKCGRSVHRSFTLCLNDRNPVISENRKTGVYMFANLEFKIYHKLNNRDMMKNLIKVIKSRQDDQFDPLPKCEESLSNDYKAQVVTYNYYMGEYYGCFENDFILGFDYLYKALLECKQEYSIQITKILILLIPFGLLSRRIFPKREKINSLLNCNHADNNNNNNNHNNSAVKIRTIYCDMMECFQNGNIKKYDEIIKEETNEIFFLVNGVYVAMQLIREFILLKLVKTCYKLNDEKSIIPFDIILLGINNKRIDTSELECELANLISKGYIKGYLSHGNGCMVVSKKDPFPILVEPVSDIKTIF